MNTMQKQNHKENKSTNKLKCSSWISVMFMSS
jgi:hypothetical protein